MGIVKSLFQRDPLGDDTRNETQVLTGNKYPSPDASPSTKEQIEGLRAKANDYRQRYHDLSRRAKQAYSSGHKADAHTFSLQAHANKEEMEDADKQAVDLLIRQQQASINQGELDLHGFYVNETIDCVRDVLADQSETYRLTVITGKGLHSTGGVAKIRPAIISYLEKHNYRYTLCPGVIEVGIQTDAPRKPRGNDEECCVIC